MNGYQFQVMLLEAQQRGRRIIDSFMEDQQNAPYPNQTQLPDQVNGQRNNNAGQDVLSQGNLRNAAPNTTY